MKRGSSVSPPLALQMHVDLKLDRELNVGAQGRVYLGSLCTSPSLSSSPAARDSSSEWITVAVKKPIIASSADLERYRDELVVLSKLNGHPNIVRMLGAKALPPDYLLVLEYMPRGSLDLLLHRDGFRPDLETACYLGLDLIAALEHMHNVGYVHRDIKPANILLTEATEQTGSHSLYASASCRRRCHHPHHHPMVVAKLSDFGLAAPMAQLQKEAEDPTSRLQAGQPSGGFHKRAMVGTLQYMCPQVLNRSGAHGSAGDVYAWAVTLNEIITGVIPYSDCTKNNPACHTVLDMGYGRQELAVAVCAQGLRPLPSTDPRVCRHPAFPFLLQLLDRCWVGDPSRRPSASQVRQELEHILVTFFAHGEKGHETSSPSPSPSPLSLSLSPRETAPRSALRVAVDDGREKRENDDDPLFSTSSSPAASPVSSASYNPGDTEDHWPTVTEYDTTVTAPSSSPPESGLSWAQVKTLLDETFHEAVSTIVELCPIRPEDGAKDITVDPSVGETPISSSSCWWSRYAPPASPNAHGATQHMVSVSLGSFASQGRRDHMEDRHVVARDLNGQSGVHLLAVFDGHRGAAAAEYAASGLLPWIKRLTCPDNRDVMMATENEHLTSSSSAPGVPVTSPAQLLHETLIRLDRGYVGEESARWADRLDRAATTNGGTTTTTTTSEHGTLGTLGLRRSYAGCTAITALIVGNGLWIANLGDCRAVLSRGGKAHQLTRDHSTTDVGEQARVVHCSTSRRRSGEVASAAPSLSWRVDGYRLGSAGIQVTRGLGDMDVKRDGLSAEAEISYVSLRPSDEFLILASDGLYEVLTNNDVVGLVRDTVKEPSMCGRRLVTEAMARGSKDNITVTVAFLQPVETLERIYSEATGETHQYHHTFYGSRNATSLAALHAQGPSVDELTETY